jgi:naphthalene 1,2-dioxygenase ferredoxin component
MTVRRPNRRRCPTSAASRLSYREVIVSWINVARLSQLTSDYPTALNVEGHRVALYVVDDAVYATSNICTHQFALLSDGYQEGGEIECPLHQGRFDIRSGKALCAPLSADLATYEVEVRSDEVWIRIEANE